MIYLSGAGLPRLSSKNHLVPEPNALVAISKCMQAVKLCSSKIHQVLTAGISRYGDGAGNTVEENSSVFSLIRMR